MGFFNWFLDDSDGGKLSRFWKKVTDFIQGKSSKDPIEEVEEVFEESAIDAVEREFIPLVQSNMRNGEHVYTGHAIDNIFAEAPEPGRVTVGIRDAEYFGRVEFGSEPRTIDASEFSRLIHWVTKKDTKGEVIDPRAVALAVKKTLESEGNREHAIFSDALDATEGKLKQEIRANLEWRFDR